MPPKKECTTWSQQRDRTHPTVGTVSHHKTVTLAATDVAQKANTWQRTEGGRATRRDGGCRDCWWHSILQTFFPTSLSHYPETILDTINPARHCIISRKDTDCTYTSRRDIALPPSYPNLLPVRVVTATHLQLYDPTLRNAVHAA